MHIYVYDSESGLIKSRMMVADSTKVTVTKNAADLMAEREQGLPDDCGIILDGMVYAVDDNGDIDESKSPIKL